MVGHMNIEEQVDADFGRARRRASLHRLAARIRGGPSSAHLPSFEESRRAVGAYNRVHLGTRVVPVGKIVGSVGRSTEFDPAFLPTRVSARTKWRRIDRAFHRGEELPPVILFKLGDAYFVLDGNHRVSMYRYHGVEWLDADVTEFHVPSLSGRKGGEVRGESSETGGLTVHDMMASQLAKQRREEMVREAERSHLARTVCGPRKRLIPGLVSSLVWELKRAAGRLRKLI